MRINLITVAVAIVFVAVILSLVPGSSSGVSRSKIGELEADIMGDGKIVKIVKIKAEDKNGTSIYLEVYDKDEKLLKSILLPEAKDAQFVYKNQRNNMFAADIDGDGIKDVLTISRNNKGESKLSVLTYKNSEFKTTL
jgi:hypothetical protein